MGIKLDAIFYIISSIKFTKNVVWKLTNHQKKEQEKVFVTSLYCAKYFVFLSPRQESNFSFGQLFLTKTYTYSFVNSTAQWIFQFCIGYLKDWKKMWNMRVDYCSTYLITFIFSIDYEPRSSDKSEKGIYGSN